MQKTFTATFALLATLIFLETPANAKENTLPQPLKSPTQIQDISKKETKTKQKKHLAKTRGPLQDLSPKPSDEQPLIKDAKLKKIIELHMPKKTDPINKTDLEKITTLYASNMHIKDLSGIEYLINATHIDLSGNNPLTHIPYEILCSPKLKIIKLPIHLIENLESKTCWEKINFPEYNPAGEVILSQESEDQLI